MYGGTAPKGELCNKVCMYMMYVLPVDFELRVYWFP